MRPQPNKSVGVALTIAGALTFLAGLILYVTWIFPEIDRPSVDTVLISQSRWTIPALIGGAVMVVFGLFIIFIKRPRRRETTGRLSGSGKVRLGGRVMSTATGPRANPAKPEAKGSIVMTLVFLIIGLSVMLSYGWGAPTPQFRSDAPNVILLGILVAAFIYLAARYGGQNRLRPRHCTTCGRGIPFNAQFCPYCGHQFAGR